MSMGNLKMVSNVLLKINWAPFTELFNITVRNSNRVFFEKTEVGIIAIFVLLKYENKLELIGSDISFNSLSPQQI